MEIILAVVFRYGKWMGLALRVKCLSVNELQETVLQIAE